MATKKIFLRILEPIKREKDFQVMNKFLPEIRIICSNPIRAGILHLLINTSDTLHSMRTEELAVKLGVRPRVLIYHLERLEKWGLVKVKKTQKYGNKERRVIWGLDLNHPNWILECYRHIRAYFFTEKELKELTNKNKSYRK